MSKLKDLTGMQFGYWKVLRRGENSKYKCGSSATTWICQCTKNSEYITTKIGSELRKVKSKTCRACPGCHNLDLTGRRFGRWKVLQRADDYIDSTGRVYHRWLCECSCEKHTKKVVLAKNLLRGSSQSCGCLVVDVVSEMFATHRKTNTRLYGIWSNMKKRCTNKNDPAYRNYGGRGISVCDEWNNYERFEEWAMSHGYSDLLTIDRIDNSKGYSPDNCRWATYKEQANNTRSNVHVVINGVDHTVAEWSDITGVPTYEIYFRMHHGWDGERAVMTPLQKRNKIESAEG